MVRNLFDRHGSTVVFFGRFVYAAFLAGTTRMPWRRILIYNAAGSVLWAALYTFASYGLGNALHSVETALTVAVAAAAATTISAEILVLRRRNRRHWWKRYRED